MGDIGIHAGKTLGRYYHRFWKSKNVCADISQFLSPGINWMMMRYPGAASQDGGQRGDYRFPNFLPAKKDGAQYPGLLAPKTVLLERRKIANYLTFKKPGRGYYNLIPRGTRYFVRRSQKCRPPAAGSPEGIIEALANIIWKHSGHVRTAL